MRGHNLRLPVRQLRVNGLHRPWTTIPARAILKRTILTRAFAEGPTEPPLLEDTIPGHFNKIVNDHGDRLAVVSSHQKQRLTYHELNRKANAVAQGLRDVGVQKGERVAVMLGNNIEYAIVTYAIFKLGAILVPLNPAFGASQVTSALTHLSASHLVIGTETNLPFKLPRSNMPILKHLVPDLSRGSLASELVPSLRSLVLVDNSAGQVDTSDLGASIPFNSLLHASSLENDPVPLSSLDPFDIINIQFTSGTTSTPKAACLTHRSILNNGDQIGSRMLLTPEDRVVCPPPLFHCFGCILGYMATATHGSSIIFPSEAFSPSATLEAVIAEKGTALYGVPTMFVSELDMLAAEPAKYPKEGFSHLHTGIAAGSSIPAELMRKLHRTLNLTELTICYGMTETSPVSLMTTTDDPLDKRISTVGRLLPHVKAKIVDPMDRSKILELGERGELVVSGYLTMQGYWNDKNRTDEVLIRSEDGTTFWMHTGDEAMMDADGYVSITGRIKDLIIRGGENIHPLEIENCLLAHPSVTDVSVVGVADEKYGEVVGAFIIRRHHGIRERETEAEPDSEAVESWIKDLRDHVRQALSHHLVPKHFFFVDEFPKTASGKIQKFKLRELAKELLGQE